MKPSIFQIKQAVVKNTCAPDESEWEQLSTSKVVRTSIRMEGDAELGLVLLIGMADAYGHGFEEIHSLASVERDEYDYKLAKFKAARKTDPRYSRKIALIQNYLYLTHGIPKVLATRRV